MKESILPFGLTFEELPTSEEDLSKAISYDEELEVSVVIDEFGNKIPLVECSMILGTKTFTKVQNEGVDDDPGAVMLTSTKTMSEVKTEDSDADDGNCFAIMGTRTATAIKAEQTDDDEMSPLKTRTATFVSTETSDSD